MKLDAGSARRRSGTSLLWLEPLEDRQPLSGINPVGAGQALPTPEANMAVVSSAVPISAQEASQQTSHVSPRDATGSTTAPYRATNPSANASGDAANYPYDATPADMPGEGYRSGAGQSEYYSQSGAANQTSLESAYALFGQQGLGVTPGVKAADVVLAPVQLSENPAPRAAEAAGSPPPTVDLLSAEAAKGIADPAGAVHFQRPPNSRDVGFVAALQLQTPEELASDAPVEGHPAPARALATGEWIYLAPQLGNLLGGAVPVDLTTLNRTVDELFSRLEGLAEDVWALPATWRLSPWVVLALAGTGAFEFTRRWLRSPEPAIPSADGEDSDWILPSALALFPPEEMP
jgi:hypothetical protein